MNNSLIKAASRVELQKKITVLLGCLIEALALVSVCLTGLCKNKLKLDKSTGVLTLTIALALCVCDLYAPAMGRSLRQGAGFGVGAMLVGFP
tara:strand:+ start:713 stop:988 length:276 start_codon:yes stop_codon:yes gene_type:complete